MNDSLAYELTTAPLDVQGLVALLQSNDDGAVVSFVGTVRQRSDGEPRPVVSIEYEAYAVMAIPELRAIVSEAQRGTGARVIVRHRLGVVPLGEASVVIVAAAPHRAAAFDACEFAIDELKRRVPIWKKEWYVDGTSRWGDGSVIDTTPPVIDSAFTPGDARSSA